MYEPFYADFINQHDSQFVPGTIHPADTRLARYFRRYLLQKVCSLYDIEGSPETWSAEYVKYCLFGWGSCAVFNTNKFGIIPQACGYYGYNVFYRPTHAVISNPLFDKTYRLRIGSECELIRLSPDWCGIADLIGHYADLMALVCSSIVSNLSNTKLSYVFTAEGNGVAESFKKMFDKVAEGNPAVFVDKKLFGEDGEPRWAAFQQHLKEVYIVDLLQAAEKQLESDFYTQIGIPNVGFEKKERLVTPEVNANNFATQCLSDLWLRTMTETTDKVNKLFGLNISIKYTKALQEQIDSANMGMEGGSEDGVQDQPKRTSQRG